MISTPHILAIDLGKFHTIVCHFRHPIGATQRPFHYFLLPITLSLGQPPPGK